jgi:hypothetical protein
VVDKPKLSSGYEPQLVMLVRQTCLYIATRLGDLMDEVRIVGGLVPSLLIRSRAHERSASGAVVRAIPPTAS